MKEKPPLIDGERPVQMYWLDSNPRHRIELGYEMVVGERCADLYTEYPGAKYYVVEFKSQEIYHALTQLSETTRKLVKIGHPVTGVIIIIKNRIKKGEQKLFGRNPTTHELLNPYTKKPYTISLRNRTILIKLIYQRELELEYRRVRQRTLSEH